MPFTPNSELDLLFSADVIPTEFRDSVPLDLHLRPLARTDHSRSHLSVLAVLTSAPAVSPSAYAANFAALQAAPHTYYTIALVSRVTDQIVAVGTLFLERKFTRGLGRVGHIEDIAVGQDQQGRGLGKVIVCGLAGISEALGCYKTILDCNDNNIPFYVKCGFEKKETEMVRYNANANTTTNGVEIERAQTPSRL